ncbi:MAG: PSD1 and planctomycete cytochrome C domain-containing protein [Bryobacteraceae bacterium]
MLRAMLTVPVLAIVAQAASDGDFFETKIRPILVSRCHACHTKTMMGGLRLDSREALVRGGKSGAAVIAGKPSGSLLIQAVQRTHARLKMPPTGALPKEEVDLLVEWVARGAVWPGTAQAPAAGGHEFWSFQPLRKPEAAAVGGIDSFVEAKWKQAGLRPAPAADRRTLIRRVSLDLTGLPPTPEQVEAFVTDRSADAFAKVVDRLLESPHYGERWGRYWLDLARYSDGLLAAGVDTPLPNAYRYRDWVVNAFNRDLPYDLFVKAQIAADLLPEADRHDLRPGLGFQAIARNADDQVDVTTKVFLGLTVGCAQCHDHKYDPIPTKDYYSLLGIFRSSAKDQYALVSPEQVELYERRKKEADDRKERIADFLKDQQSHLVDTLARRTADYMVAAWKGAEASGKLDAETLARWKRYLSDPDKEHPYMKPWFALMATHPSEEQVRAEAEKFQKFFLQLIDDAKEVDDKNYVAFGGRKGMKDEKTRQYTNIVSLPVLKFYQWRELAAEPYRKDGVDWPGGVYYYSAKEMDRWLNGFARDYVETLRAEVKAIETEMGPAYPFLHTLKEGDQPRDVRVAIRGDGKNLGEEAPRRFLTALCEGEPEPITKGSGRMELAEAIARSPLAARVMVNRVWQHHFGHGIVRSASNFGQMGERPTHPELLEYLAWRFQESGWSLKALHREMLLSRTYQLSSRTDAASNEKDPDNKLLWRGHVQHRLDLEALRDSMLAVSGELDSTVGGKPSPIGDSNFRRSLYLTVSRTRLDGTMVLFDFPDPNATAEDRAVTAGPLQGLFFLNSPFVASRAEALGKRLAKEAGEDAAARIRRAYGLLLARGPDAEELKLGMDYVAAGGAKLWQQYLQALLASGEFTSVN